MKNIIIRPDDQNILMIKTVSTTKIYFSIENYKILARNQSKQLIFADIARLII